MPLDGFSLSSPFGLRNHPVTGRPKFHMGVDLLPGSSDAVKPAKAGKIVMAHDYQDYGNTVIIRHDRGIETLYAHLASMNVREGQDVDVDTVIGMVGNTGSSTGKHLHFEISVGGYPVDPLKVIETASYVQKSSK
jgi:murein DD-endopeptidase MepM/ murein hydrolase activator NlpD